MNGVCPCCAAALPDDGHIRIDAEGGFVCVGRHVVRLPESEFYVFLALWRVRPRMLSTEALMDALYGLKPDDEPEEPIMKIFVHKVRRKLAPLGIEIETVWGRGYRLKSNRKEQS